MVIVDVHPHPAAVVIPRKLRNIQPENSRKRHIGDQDQSTRKRPHRDYGDSVAATIEDVVAASAAAVPSTYSKKKRDDAFETTTELAVPFENDNDIKIMGSKFSGISTSDEDPVQIAITEAAAHDIILVDGDAEKKFNPETHMVLYNRNPKTKQEQVIARNIPPIFAKSINQTDILHDQSLITCIINFEKGNYKSVGLVRIINCQVKGLLLPSKTVYLDKSCACNNLKKRLLGPVFTDYIDKDPQATKVDVYLLLVNPQTKLPTNDIKIPHVVIDTVFVDYSGLHNSHLTPSKSSSLLPQILTKGEWLKGTSPVEIESVLIKDDSEEEEGNSKATVIPASTKPSSQQSSSHVTPNKDDGHKSISSSSEELVKSSPYTKTYEQEQIKANTSIAEHTLSYFDSDSEEGDSFTKTDSEGEKRNQHQTTVEGEGDMTGYRYDKACINLTALQVKVSQSSEFDEDQLVQQLNTLTSSTSFKNMVQNGKKTYVKLVKSNTNKKRLQMCVIRNIENIKKPLFTARTKAKTVNDLNKLKRAFVIDKVLNPSEICRNKVNMAKMNKKRRGKESEQAIQNPEFKKFFSTAFSDKPKDLTVRNLLAYVANACYILVPELRDHLGSPDSILENIDKVSKKAIKEYVELCSVASLRTFLENAREKKLLDLCDYLYLANNIEYEREGDDLMETVAGDYATKLLGHSAENPITLTPNLLKNYIYFCVENNVNISLAITGIILAIHNLFKTLESNQSEFKLVCQTGIADVLKRATVNVRLNNKRYSKGLVHAIEVLLMMAANARQYIYLIHGVKIMGKSCESRFNALLKPMMMQRLFKINQLSEEDPRRKPLYVKIGNLTSPSNLFTGLTFNLSFTPNDIVLVDVMERCNSKDLLSNFCNRSETAYKFQNLTDLQILLSKQGVAAESWNRIEGMMKIVNTVTVLEFMQEWVAGMMVKDKIAYILKRVSSNMTKDYEVIKCMNNFFTSNDYMINIDDVKCVKKGECSTYSDKLNSIIKHVKSKMPVEYMLMHSVANLDYTPLVNISTFNQLFNVPEENNLLTQYPKVMHSIFALQCFDVNTTPMAKNIPSYYIKKIVANNSAKVAEVSKMFSPVVTGSYTQKALAKQYIKYTAAVISSASRKLFDELNEPSYLLHDLVTMIARVYAHKLVVGAETKKASHTNYKAAAVVDKVKVSTFTTIIYTSLEVFLTNLVSVKSFQALANIVIAYYTLYDFLPQLCFVDMCRLYLSPKTAMISNSELLLETLVTRLLPIENFIMKTLNGELQQVAAISDTVQCQSNKRKTPHQYQAFQRSKKYKTATTKMITDSVKSVGKLKSNSKKENDFNIDSDDDDDDDDNDDDDDDDEDDDDDDNDDDDDDNDNDDDDDDDSKNDDDDTD